MYSWNPPEQEPIDDIRDRYLDALTEPEYELFREGSLNIGERLVPKVAMKREGMEP